MKKNLMKQYRKVIITNGGQETEPFIYGYKALDKNLCASMGNGMQYQVGKTYEVNSKAIFCENGFHFCKTLAGTLNYYTPDKNLRFIKIKAYGEVLSNERKTKHLCEKIEVVKELSGEEILEELGLDNNNTSEEELLNLSYNVKILLALKGFFTKTIAQDENSLLRLTLAREGVALKTLVNDESPSVRIEVARHRFGLATLVDDEVEEVRRVAREQLELTTS